ncbi:MAG: hypothetical protein ACJ739_08945 [Acidimicrobiales bacterium]
MTPARRGRALLAVACLLALGSCSDDGDHTPSSTTGSSSTTASTIAPDDPTLEPVLLTAADLPDGFAATEDVAETVTTFCAGQDATAGLRADGRAIVAFTRTPEGASVIEVVFRFEDDGATTFVHQAGELMTSCSEVPDATGLAFTYEPLSPAVAASLTDADESASAFGTSVGSGDLHVQIAAMVHEDLGALVAVLGFDEPRADLDALASTAFEAAVAKLG